MYPIAAMRVRCRSRPTFLVGSAAMSRPQPRRPFHRSPGIFRRTIGDMAQVHMTEAEVASDFAAVLRKVGHGEEVVVNSDGRAVAVIKAADPERRTLSQLIELAGEREKRRGYAVTLDEDYAADVEQIVRERKPWTRPSWE